jgi:predicted RNA-binding protein with PIN domain
MKGRLPVEPRRFRWIVDGHNAIFAHPALEPLQTGGERAEARRRLEMMVERFAVENGIDIMIVYDGNRMERNPDARRDGPVRTQYSLPPDEDADDRIVFLAIEALRQGRKPLVVSSDRATLGARLPAGVAQIDPEELFHRIQQREKRRSGGDERPPGDFSDIEAHFLSLDSDRKRDPSVDDAKDVSGSVDKVGTRRGRSNGQKRR